MFYTIKINLPFLIKSLREISNANEKEKEIKEKAGTRKSPTVLGSVNIN
jgi:hypothetical protein